MFEELLEVAERDPQRSLALTELVTRNLDRVEVPAEARFALHFLRGDAWIARGKALLHAGDLPAATEAYERAAPILSEQPVMVPELPYVECARAGFVPWLLHETPHAEWPALAKREELRNAATVGALCRESASRRERMPLESLATADMAIAIAETLTDPESPEHLAALHAEAWRRRGLALRTMSRYAEALTAFDRGEEILMPFGTNAHERPLLGLARALTLTESAAMTRRSSRRRKSI